MKYLDYDKVSPLLNKKAKYIKEIYDQRKDTKSVHELKIFMDKFKLAHAEHKLLELHIGLVEKVVQVTNQNVFRQNIETETMLLNNTDRIKSTEYLKEALYTMKPMDNVLKLMAFWSLTAKKDISDQMYESIKQDFLHSYGYENMYILDYLEKLQLLMQHSTKKETFCSQFELMINNIFKQQLIKSNKMLDYIPGSSIFKKENTGNIDKRQNKKILICIVGGITYSEIHDLRLLEQKYNSQYTICTTNIITNSDKFIRDIYT